MSPPQLPPLVFASAERFGLRTACAPLQDFVKGVCQSEQFKERWDAVVACVPGSSLARWHPCVLSTLSLAQRRECRRQLTPRPRELTPLALCYTENGQLFIQLLAPPASLRLARRSVSERRMRCGRAHLVEHLRQPELPRPRIGHAGRASVGAARLAPGGHSTSMLFN